MWFLQICFKFVKTIFWPTVCVHMCLHAWLYFTLGYFALLGFGSLTPFNVINLAQGLFVLRALQFSHNCLKIMKCDEGQPAVAATCGKIAHWTHLDCSSCQQLVCRVHLLPSFRLNIRLHLNLKLLLKLKLKLMLNLAPWQCLHVAQTTNSTRTQSQTQL